MIEAPTIHIGLLVFELHLPAAQSLKDKRRVIKSVRERLRSKFNVSVAEVGEQDKWQLSVGALTIVGGDRQFLDKVLNSVHTFLRTLPEAVLIDCRMEFI